MVSVMEALVKSVVEVELFLECLLEVGSSDTGSCSGLCSHIQHRPEVVQGLLLRSEKFWC